MDLLLEKFLVYGLVAIFCVAVVLIYLRKQRRNSKIVEEKIRQAKLDGLYEPVSLHPVVDANNCIQT
nr:4Fe-4S ferredoxin [Bacteroidota bacterium]